MRNKNTMMYVIIAALIGSYFMIPKVKEFVNNLISKKSDSDESEPTEQELDVIEIPTDETQEP